MLQFQAANKQHVELLYRYTEICGFQGVVAGLLVGLKQIMPENDVTLLGYVRFRAKVLILFCAHVQDISMALVSATCSCLYVTATTLHIQQEADALSLLLVQHLASIFLCVTVAGALLLGNVIRTVPFAAFGTYSAWFYLRFFQHKPELSLQ